MVDDNVEIADIIKMVIPDEFEIFTALNGKEAIQKANEIKPSLIFMDMAMPEMNGFEATRKIKAEFPDVDIVMLTVSDDDDNLFASIRAGASGYLLKNVKPEELFRRLRGISKGEAPISPLLASKILREFARLDQSAPVPKAIDGLSGRETEVLGLVAKGMTNREIGEQLHIAENTVKNHLRNILDKLHLNNRAQAAAFAVRHGLIQGQD